MFRVFVFYLSVLSVSVLGAAGRCRVDSASFNTEEGGCLDFRSGVVWSRKAGELKTYTQANDYCRRLTIANQDGFSDWDLPTDAELKSLSQNETAKTHLAFSTVGFFWSRSADSEGAWAVPLTQAEDAAFLPLTESAGAICRRLPRDRDKDFVPDSSDRCSQTERGQKVETTGMRKGCSPMDEEFIVLKPGPCPTLSEVDCRRTGGCGWSFAKSACIDITSKKCEDYPDASWCRLTRGCVWTGDACEKLK